MKTNVTFYLKPFVSIVVDGSFELPHNDKKSFQNLQPDQSINVGLEKVSANFKDFLTTSQQNIFWVKTEVCTMLQRQKIFQTIFVLKLDQRSVICIL